MLVSTYLSRNEPSAFLVEYDWSKTTDDVVPFNGEVELTGESQATTDENEGIVFDTGRFTVKNENDTISRKLFRQKASEEANKIDLMNPPSQWTEAVNHSFVKDSSNRYAALYIKSGDGKEKVMLETPVLEAGTYDLYYFLPDLHYEITVYKTSPDYRNIFGDIYISVTNKGLANEIRLNLNDDSNGWKYVGTYTIDNSNLTMEISDKSDGRIVLVDAVKLVKK